MKGETLFTKIPWTADHSPPDKTNVDGADQQIVPVGLSMHGWIYRTEAGTAYYRLLPLHEVSAARKVTLRDWTDRQEERKLARIVNASQQSFGLDYFAVEYEVSDARCSLTEALEQESSPSVLDHVVQVLRALPAWWARLGAPLFLMPADIVLNSEGEATLLPLPSWSRPTIGKLLVEPQRIRYIAPEYLRWTVPDQDPEAWQLSDLYAVAMMLVPAFFELTPSTNAAELLHAVVTGTSIDWEKPSARLPSWLGRVRATLDIGQVLQQLCATNPKERAFSSLKALTDLLELCHKRMQPEIAVKEARRSSTLAAFSLLQECLISHRSYELLLKGGELAAECKLLLEAIDFYERAMKIDPARPEAYEMQLRLITSARSPEEPLHDYYRQYINIGTRLDQRLHWNFNYLAGISPTFGRDYELTIAKHYLWRGEQFPVFYNHAADFIYPRLFDGNRKFLPWKFELNLAYCEALLGQDRVKEARRNLDVVRKALKTFGKHSGIAPGSAKRALCWADELEKKIEQKSFP